MIKRLVLVLLGMAALSGCYHAPPVISPPGYDLASPTKFVVSEVLHEISGIVFLKGNPDSMYAIEDEAGKLFYFHLGDNKYPYWRFGRSGDYEDVTILNGNEFVVLRSDGSLYAFPTSTDPRGKEGHDSIVKIYEHILPKGEYEGLYGDDSGKLIALCKDCPIDDQRDEVSAYTLKHQGGGDLAIADHFLIDVPQPLRKQQKHRDKFHPSCLARHPLTHEWYIISSVNKVLVICDDKWKVKGFYSLDPILFKQPEGLAFDRAGNMYVSNEGHGGNANVLLFPYKQ